MPGQGAISGWPMRPVPRQNRPARRRGCSFTACRRVGKYRVTELISGNDLGLLDGGEIWEKGYRFPLPRDRLRSSSFLGVSVPMSSEASFQSKMKPFCHIYAQWDQSGAHRRRRPRICSTLGWSATRPSTWARPPSSKKPSAASRCRRTLRSEYLPRLARCLVVGLQLVEILRGAVPHPAEEAARAVRAS